MSDAKLEALVTACVAEQVADLRALTALIAAKLPDLDPQLAIPGQPCDTEFLTTGFGNSANRVGFTTAYADAQSKAQTICNTGNCRTLKFKRYVEASTPGNKWVLRIAWECDS